MIGSHLVLPPDVWRVHHVIAPVLLDDLFLLFVQKGQLLVAALHVFIQALQVVVPPLGVILKEGKKVPVNL